MAEEDWVAVYTKANQESVAVAHIRRQSFEAYCPQIVRTLKHARKIQQVERPLFPSYVFVKYDKNRSQWRSLLSTRGVRSLVKFGDKLGVVPSELIETLRSSEENGQLNRVAAPKVAPGDEVELSEGPFCNFVGRVLSLPDKDRVWLLLDMMGQQVRVLQNTSVLIPS